MSVSLANSISTFFYVRSLISKSFTKRHMLFSVYESASMLTRHLVKSFATSTLLLSSMSCAKGIV